MTGPPASDFSQRIARLFSTVVRYTPRERPNVIAVVNLKGGCGKSTIAVNLACELACQRDRAVLIDNDSQGTSTRWLNHEGLPVRSEFMPLEDEHDGEQLIRAIAQRTERYVVVDAPAHVGAASQAAGRIADLVLIPVTASGVDLDATRFAVDLIREARRRRNSAEPKCLIVPSKIDRRTDAGRNIVERLGCFGEPIGPAIHQRTSFVEAFSAGQWIGQYAPQSPAHYDIATLAIAVRRLLRV